MLQNKTRIALVDDHPIVVEGLEKVLSVVKHMKIAGRFTNGKDLLSFLNYTAVDIVLLDITLPDINGIDLCKSIKTNFPQIVVLALSNLSNRGIIIDVLKNGASGYLLKNVSRDELVSSINTALRGEIVFSQDVKEIISSPQLTNFPETARLTTREKEVLGLIALGKTTAEISGLLYISKFTVESHRKNLLQKFNARNVAELIRMATQQGFL
ncbi:MAG: response regulator transcription factor [Niabella sp.]|nr:response regulator transcription factor [Niabella sp.]